jgi:hypothetical protein
MGGPRSSTLSIYSLLPAEKPRGFHFAPYPSKSGLIHKHTVKKGKRKRGKEGERREGKKDESKVAKQDKD